MDERELLYKVLDYPLVQYITLTRRDVVREQVGSLLELRKQVELTLITSKKELESAYYPIGVNRLEVSDAVDFNRKFAVIAQNYDVSDLKYRTTEITAIGSRKPGLYYLFSIDRHLFYRRQVYFKCFDSFGEEIRIPTKIYSITLRRRTG